MRKHATAGTGLQTLRNEQFLRWPIRDCDGQVGQTEADSTNGDHLVARIFYRQAACSSVVPILSVLG
jgi:hypothetical protein